MVTQVKWVERSFNFDIPADLYPVLVERLSGTPARLEEKINNAPFMILSQPCNSGWSIQEHAGHLADLEELFHTRIKEYEQGAVTLTAADMTNKKTHDAQHNNADIKDILKNFRKMRMELVKKLQNYDNSMTVKTALHPRLDTPMRLIDSLYFIAEHDDHHLATITNIEMILT